MNWLLPLRAKALIWAGDEPSEGMVGALVIKVIEATALRPAAAATRATTLERVLSATAGGKRQDQQGRKYSVLAHIHDPLHGMWN